MREELKKIHQEKCNILHNSFLYIPSYKTDLARVLRDKYGFAAPTQIINLKEFKK